MQQTEKPQITRFEPEKRQGLVVVITGHGKGKTTSALGMVLRAAGHGLKIVMIQFMKGLPDVAVGITGV